MKTKITLRRLDTIRSALLEIADLQEPLIETTDGVRRRTEKRTNPVVLRSRASYALRRNLARLDSVLDPLAKEKQRLIKIHSQEGKINLNLPTLPATEPGGQPVENTARIAFLKEWDAQLDFEDEFDFYVFDDSELDLDRNNIPVRLLHAIEPILTHTEEAAKDTGKVPNPAEPLKVVK